MIEYIAIQVYATVDISTKNMTSLSKSMYTDVKHIENTTVRDVNVIDSNDVKYSAIAGTRSAPVSLDHNYMTLCHRPN